MNNLYEEYKKYYEYLEKKEELNKVLSDLRGKNDPDSINKINDLAGNLNEINTILSCYDNTLLVIADNYFKGLEELSKVNEDIKLLEKISKKVTYVNDRVEVFSADNRRKLIDKEYRDEYKNLTAKKIELRKNNLVNYNLLKGITSLVNKVVKEDKVSTLKEKESDVLDEYDKLSLDEKIKETYERIDRIFKSNFLPNMGKKVLVTFEGTKHSIPEIYYGRYKETVRELNKLKNLKENKEKEQRESIEHKLNLSTAGEIVSNNKKEIVVDPIEVTFNKPLNVSNLDKKMALSFNKMESVLLDKGIKIKTDSIIFADNTKQKFNTLKGYVTKVSKKTVSNIKDRFKEYQKFLNEKKSVISDVKRSGSIKTSMKNIYGEESDNHLDYRIVNRAVNFNGNVCQKVNETKSSIVKVSKNFIDKISEPFRGLRESMKDEIERKDLDNEIARVKQENLNKKNELKRIKRLEDIKTSGGYVAIGTLTVVAVLVAAVLIFKVVGNLLG